MICAAITCEAPSPTPCRGLLNTQRIPLAWWAQPGAPTPDNSRRRSAGALIARFGMADSPAGGTFSSYGRFQPPLNRMAKGIVALGKGADARATPMAVPTPRVARVSALHRRLSRTWASLSFLISVWARGFEPGDRRPEDS